MAKVRIQRLEVCVFFGGSVLGVDIQVSLLTILKQDNMVQIQKPPKFNLEFCHLEKDKHSRIALYVQTRYLSVPLWVGRDREMVRIHLIFSRISRFI